MQQILKDLAPLVDQSNYLARSADNLSQRLVEIQHQLGPLPQHTTGSLNTSMDEQWLVGEPTLRKIHQSLQSVSSSFHNIPAGLDSLSPAQQEILWPWLSRISVEVAEVVSLISQILLTEPYAGSEIAPLPLLIGVVEKPLDQPPS